MSTLVTSRSWRDGVVTDDDLTRDELARAVHDRDVLVWIDLLAPSSERLAEIAEELGLPVTAVEDALAPKERPKLIRHDSHLFFTTYAVLPAEGDSQGMAQRTTRVSGWCLPSALVTIRLDDRFSMAPVVAFWEENPHLLREGSGALLHGLLDAVVDTHFEAIEALDDQLEALEDVLFEERTTGASFARKVYGIRKDLVALRRVVLPMREVVTGLMRHPDIDSSALRPWFDDLTDHVLRAGEWTESLRDLLTSAFETNLSLTDSRLNTIMKKLAAWGAIIAVPTAITGWFGQNVPYFGYAQPVGVVLSAALVVVGVVVLYALFRRNNWL
ncbi:magnesium transporter CorA family protein [Tessaracoccus sp. SD287]|uniref:magnesium transporter CorA family protein n=1 Tax=Tessaracoccus sp. SD287 TaxID=2782008 RepID=UPI001A970546|nr:magnesium transporter CorA family protein [Tessaracoccus sp. SD287]MBO1031341.1 magnesium transporter CorA family protein [Tessaracoccus sp. SD287]